MPGTMKLSTIISSSNSSSANVTGLSAVFPIPCDNLIDFVGHDGLGQSAENVTCLKHAPKLTRAVYRQVIVLAIMSVLSLICNAATIYSIAKNRRKQRGCSAIYTLILHLSVADLLVTVFCLAGDAIWSYNVAWLWGNAACKIFKFLQMFSLYLSTFVLVLIGVDRFVAVRYPMKGLNTSHKCSRFVLLAWVLSFVLATPQVAIFHVSQGPFIEEFPQCVTHGFYTEPWQEQLYASFSLFFMFLLPLAILITTYVSTVITISQSQKMFKAEPVRAAFLIWWTPYYTMMIIFLFLNPDEHLSQELQNGIFFFGMSNSLVNPLIYGAFHLWPQKQRRGSYQSYRSDFTMRSMRKPMQSKSSLLSHQENGCKVQQH
ncbi:corazonin receptor isoform X3 [Polyergus mexicanus]|uniref:corazonin receptor isoform X3 n=1 Tax=Polyergus mexicanus TaxID=615972 RepID=UPI0038B5EDA7